MKLSGTAAANAADSPKPAPSLALIFGPDRGHTRDLADALIARRSKDIGTSLETARLNEDELKGDTGRLVSELSATSLFGEVRAVRVRLSGETYSSTVIKALEAVEAGFEPQGIMVVEAGDLQSRSRLRLAFEAARNAVSFQLFESAPAELGRLLKDTLKANKLTIDDAALTMVLAAAPPERDSIRAEAEKIALFCLNRNADITVSDIKELGIGGREGDIDEAVFAALSGRAAEASGAITRAFAGSAVGVQAVRSLERQSRSLLEMRGALAAGRSENDVIARVFVMKRAETLRQLKRWPRPELERLLASCRRAELSIKRAGSPDASIIEHLFLECAAQTFSDLR